MDKKNRKKFSERIIGIFLSIVIINFTVFFVKGFAELIQNQSSYVITFYGFVTILVGWRLVDFLKESLNLIFDKKNLMEVDSSEGFMVMGANPHH